MLQAYIDGSNILYTNRSSSTTKTGAVDVNYYMEYFVKNDYG